MEPTQAFKLSTDYDGTLRKYYNHNCQVCHGEYWIPKHIKQIYCSPKCNGQAKSIRQTTDVICTRCGTNIRKRQSALLNGKHQKFFCSRKCKDLAQRLDGNCPEIRPSHYGNGIPDYRFLMMEEIQNGCIDCQEIRPYLLDVHHVDGNRRNNIKSNLKVVCANDHRRRHQQFKNGVWNFNPHVLTPQECLGEV